MKNYISFVRDHSGSMRGIARHAARDYNENIASIKEEAINHSIDTIVSVVELGYESTDLVRTVVKNSSIIALKPIDESSYTASGHGTPLFDSVGEAIEQLKSVPDADDKTVSFVVFVTTDGGENASRKYTGTEIARLVRELQMTDRWTFVFRVPLGHAGVLTRYGIPAGNIQEWDNTVQGITSSTSTTKTAFRNFYAARASGATSTSRFYADTSTVTLKEVKSNLTDISREVDVYVVDSRNDGVQIKDFVEAQGVNFVKGCAFYQLSKTETVQGYKQLAIRDKNSGSVYAGDAARDLLGLPRGGDIKVSPGQNDRYEIFVQSTSFNRKLVKNTNLMIWLGATV